MERDTFSYLVSNPTELSASDVSYLEKVAEQFPFCGLSHTLLAKGYTNHANGEAASATLRKAAAYALSRNALRKLLSGEFPATRPTYESISDLLDGRVPALTYQRKYTSDSSAKEPGKPDELPQKLSGFGLDYSDVLRNEEAKGGTVVAEEKSDDLVGRLQQEQLSLIDRFIAAEPRLGPLRATHGQPGEEPEDLFQKRQTFESGGLVTESFAKIMVKQGKPDKAIETYQKLILKNPDKKAYFAQKIEELKGQIS
ncbi:MAG: hypothetical protein LH606_07930 [Cytophagaceae bacterium]|nr:hypothetical protein [Cytophagaceae bacterium]